MTGMGERKHRPRLGLGFFLAAVALLAPARLCAQAAQTISNTAFARWSTGNGQGQVASNRVDLEFAAAGALQLYVPSSGLLPAGALDSSCAGGAPGAPGAGASPLAGAALAQAQSVILGRPIVLSFASATANRYPSAIDSLVATVTTSSGDSENVRFTETGPNSGIFLAVMRTRAMPPSPGAGDCALSAAPGQLEISLAEGATSLGSAALTMLADPYGIFFDSRDGAPVDRVKVTIVNAATGTPATVYGDDGTSTFPSTVTAGQTVTDSGGTAYPFPAGEYRFPVLAPGAYRLLVEPVSPYTAPSAATPEALAALRRPDGQPFTILGGSYGQPFTLTSAEAVRIDVPLDRPSTPLVIAKSVDRAEASRGELLLYRIDIRNPAPRPSGAITLADQPPPQLRFRGGTARLDGAKLADPSNDGRGLNFALPPIPASGHMLLTYVLEVRPDARAGDALNQAQARDTNVLSNIADALVRIRDDDIDQRMVIAGRVLGGGCAAGQKAAGVPGIRVMLEDGSYAVTDRDGRYHFEGVKPGTHVVQLDGATIPSIAEAVDCENDVRSGGRGSSRFAEGLGGEYKRADFHLAPAEAPRATAAAAVGPPQREPKISDAEAAGATRDWLAGQAPGVGLLFPDADYNPRSPVTRVVVKHLLGQTLSLRVDGRPADPIAFDGTRKSAASDVAVSSWRGIPLDARSTEIAVDVRDPGGALVTTLRRTIVFANVPAHADLVPERSLLIADGIHRPVLALRVTDRGGRPVHQGVTGELALPDPYYPAMEADAQQARQLAGLERARPTWHVTGDDGIAYVELEPTTASGSVSMQFRFRDGESVREQRLDAWLSPGDRPWTIVGLAEGTAGFNRLGKHLE